MFGKGNIILLNEISGSPRNSTVTLFILSMNFDAEKNEKSNTLECSKIDFSSSKLLFFVLQDVSFSLSKIYF